MTELENDYKRLSDVLISLANAVNHCALAVRAGNICTAQLIWKECCKISGQVSGHEPLPQKPQKPKKRKVA